MAIMAAMVTKANRILKKVVRNDLRSVIGPSPIKSPAMTDATRMPVPVAVSQLSVNKAGSKVGLATTGGTRWMKLCRPATAIFTVECASIHLENCGRPQTKTTTLRMSQGIQALNTLPELWSKRWRAWAVMSSPTALRTRLGFQKRKNVTSATIVEVEAPMATRVGPLIQAKTSCVVAKVTEATRMAGQTSTMARKPA